MAKKPQSTAKAIQLLLVLLGIRFVSFETIRAIGTKSYNECRYTSVNFA